MQPGLPGPSRNPDRTRETRPSRHRGWYALLLVPFFGLLWPPLYSRTHPQLAGFPFFYWYQILWVVLVALIAAVVYRAVGD